MATNLDIDTKAVQELMRLGNFKSKRQAVDAAVKEAIAWRMQDALAKQLGTIDFDPLVLPRQLTTKRNNADPA